MIEVILLLIKFLVVSLLLGATVGIEEFAFAVIM